MQKDLLIPEKAQEPGELRTPGTCVVCEQIQHFLLQVPQPVVSEFSNNVNIAMN